MFPSGSNGYRAPAASVRLPPGHSRSQRIRTAAELPLEFVMSQATERPLYQRISAKVRRLRVLGLSLSRITASLDVSDKTAAKALAWGDKRGDVAPICARD